MKNQRIIYYGEFAYVEEHKEDPWVTLRNYCRIDTESETKTFSDTIDEAALVSIRTSEIETIEFYYEDGENIVANDTPSAIQRDTLDGTRS